MCLQGEGDLLRRATAFRKSFVLGGVLVLCSGAKPGELRFGSGGLSAPPYCGNRANVNFFFVAQALLCQLPKAEEGHTLSRSRVMLLKRGGIAAGAACSDIAHFLRLSQRGLSCNQHCVSSLIFSSLFVALVRAGRRSLIADFLLPQSGILVTPRLPRWLPPRRPLCPGLC